MLDHPPSPVQPFKRGKEFLPPSSSSSSSSPKSGYFRLFLLFTFLLFEYWVTSNNTRSAPLKWLRRRREPLEANVSTNCTASRGFAAARAPFPRSDGKPRVLIWMLDDRVVSSTFPSERDYVSIAVMHNYQYAKHKGYDFVLFRPSRKAHHLDPEGAIIDDNAIAKEFNPELKGIGKLGCFNSKIDRWRASTWCKVLVQWALSTENPLDDTLRRWDYMVFIDSDAIAAYPHLDIEDAFNNRKESGIIGGASVYGLGVNGGVEEAFGTPLGPTLFLYSDRQKDVFGNNAWNLANLGFFVARDTPQLRPLVKTWWQAEPGDDSERYDLEAYHEQQIFWRLQEWPTYSNAMRRSVRVFDSPWAPLAGGAAGNEFRNTGGWLQHVNSEEDASSFGHARNIFFSRVRNEMNNTNWKITPETWGSAVDEIINGCHMLPIDFDALDLGISYYPKTLESLSLTELWSPILPPISSSSLNSFPTPSPLPYTWTKRWDRVPVNQ